jgi:hypothetical protein
LRNIHGYDGDHPINDYKRKFRLSSATCRDSRKKISVAKEAYWARLGQHWTHATLLAEIRKLHRAGKTLRRRKVPVRLYEAGRRFFGTWERAIEKAGLNYEDVSGVRRWDRKKVVGRIRQLKAEGVSLDAKNIKRRFGYLYKAAVMQFPGSWTKALRVAGYDPDDHKYRRGRWDEEKARAWARGRIEKGKPILARDAPRDLCEFVRQRLGQGWCDFIESFGILYPGIKKRRDWSKANLVKEIRRWKRTGHPLNYSAVQDTYQALIHQARKYFGSWDRARAAAGV